MSDHSIPIILCAGQNGRALIFGYVAELPTPGEPVRLERARMAIYYPSGGAFGLAANGPPSGSRVSDEIPATLETVWQEYMEVTREAAEAFRVYAE